MTQRDPGRRLVRFLLSLGMNNVIYIVGLVVVVGLILSWLGLR